MRKYCSKHQFNDEESELVDIGSHGRERLVCWVCYNEMDAQLDVLMASMLEAEKIYQADCLTKVDGQTAVSMRNIIASSIYRKGGLTMKVLAKSKWAKTVSFDCGCEAEDVNSDHVWSVVNFCDAHDPTTDHNEGD